MMINFGRKLHVENTSKHDFDALDIPTFALTHRAQIQGSQFKNFLSSSSATSHPFVLGSFGGSTVSKSRSEVVSPRVWRRGLQLKSRESWKMQSLAFTCTDICDRTVAFPSLIRKCRWLHSPCVVFSRGFFQRGELEWCETFHEEMLRWITVGLYGYRYLMGDRPVIFEPDFSMRGNGSGIVVAVPSGSYID